MTVWSRRSWPELLMAMFTAHFDASGQEHEHPYMIVAGFVSSTKEWIGFSEEWLKVLKDYGLSAFRAADCQNFEGDFKKWKNNGKERKRLQLWSDLLGVIKKYTFYKFGVGIVIKDWQDSFTEERREELKLNAYVMCAMSCAERVKLWARRQNIATPIEYVYESGDIGSGLLHQYMVDDGFPAPIFKHKQDRIINDVFHPSCTPLQASDFLAYETFIAKKIARKKGVLALGRPAREFRDMPELVKIYEGECLADLEKNFRKARKVHGIWRLEHQ
jgi:hypothetical protein